VQIPSDLPASAILYPLPATSAMPYHESWCCRLIEFGGKEDYVHLLIDIHPALNISTLINNLKFASSRRIRNEFPDHIKRFYWKPVFWHCAYFAGTIGKVTLDTVRRYFEQKGTKEKTRKQSPNLSA